MQVFEFVASDTSGHCHEGIRQAKSRQELLGSLRQENLTPVSITEVQSANAEEKAKTAHVRYRRVRSEQLATFCWQLATMIEGGLSITSAIQTIAEYITNPYFEFILKDISSKLESGETFSDSIKAYPKVFNNLACSMAMAETGGSLITRCAVGRILPERDKLIEKCAQWPIPLLWWPLLWLS